MKKLKQLEQILTFLALVMFCALAYYLKAGNDGACWAYGGLMTFCLIGLIFVHNLKHRE